MLPDSRIITILWALAVIGWNSPHVEASTPKWEPLQLGAAVPEDALRVWGNAAPEGREQFSANNRWSHARVSKERWSQELEKWKDSTSAEGAKQRALAKSNIERMNPAVCLAQHGGALTPGILSESGGVCRLHVFLQDADRDCRTTGSSTPDCIPHVPTVNGEVYILRHSDKLHLNDLDSKESKQALPDSAMVGASLGEGLQTDNALCVFQVYRKIGLGTVERDGPRMRCISKFRQYASNFGAPMAYGNRQVYLDAALIPLKRYLVQEGLPNLRRHEYAADTISDAVEAETKLTALSDALRSMQKEMGRLLTDMPSRYQGEASRIVGELAGKQIQKLNRIQESLKKRITELEIDGDLSAFREAHLGPVLAALLPLNYVDLTAVSDQVEAETEQARLLEVQATIERLRTQLPELAPERSQQSVASMMSKDLHPLLPLLKKRLTVLKGFLTTARKKTELTALATTVSAQVEAMKTPPSKPAEALSKLIELEQLHAQLATALATSYDAQELLAHRERVLRPLTPELERTIEAIEPLLDEQARLVRFRKVMDRLRKQHSLTEPVLRSLALFERLATPEDTNETHAAMLSELMLLRPHLASKHSEVCNTVWRCDMWNEGCDEKVKPEARALCSSMESLPLTPSTKSGNRRAGQMARALTEAGYIWQFHESDTGDVPPGPYFDPIAGWLNKKVNARLRPEMRRWLSCRDLQVVDGVKRYSTWLAGCSKAGAELGEGPLRDTLSIAVESELKQFPGKVSGKKCKSMWWDFRKSFFGGAMETVCKQIQSEEARMAAIKQAEQSISSHIKRKRFSKARARLADLEKAGASEWQLNNARENIDRAEVYETDRKARKAAEKEAKRLMRQLPNFESTCKRMSNKWNAAVAKIKWAVGAGKPNIAADYQERKRKAGRVACEAQAKVYEVYRLYKGQGNSIAADQVLRTAKTCHRVWTCQ